MVGKLDAELSSAPPLPPPFSSHNSLQVVLPLTAMDPTGQLLASKAAEAMELGGGTDLWGGLEKGVELFGEGSPNRNQAMMLLTDGT